MIPENYLDLSNGVEVISYPTHTYKIDFEKKCVRQYTNSLAAMEQMVYKVLQTYRYRHEIYDWNYGVEIDDLFGKQTVYVKSELKRRIIECLMADDRVLDIENYRYIKPSGDIYNDKHTTICVEFTVKTIFGSIAINKDVSMIVRENDF